MVGREYKYDKGWTLEGSGRTFFLVVKSGLSLFVVWTYHHPGVQVPTATTSQTLGKWQSLHSNFASYIFSSHHYYEISNVV
jgi:hypothetical protein